MRVLQLVLKWSNGGVERYIEDLVSVAKDNGIECVVASVTTPVSLDHVETFGPLVSNGIMGLLTQGTLISSFIKEGNYHIVHIHGNNGLAYLFAHFAVRGGAKAIVHSHNSSFGDGSKGLKVLFTLISRGLYSNDCYKKFACSKAAGNFLFSINDYEVVKNGVNIQRFCYNPQDRIDVRHELKIPDEVPLLGFCASVVDAKNPFFTLNIFRQLIKEIPDARFVVCGDGELLDSFKKEASYFLSEKRCVCTGRVADIERYYSAIDVLLAPSKYEGLPINLIEAQASGLSIVMSDAISEEVVVVPQLCSRLPLNADMSFWVKEIVKSLRGRTSRSSMFADVVKSAGYSQPECFNAVISTYEEASIR